MSRHDSSAPPRRHDLAPEPPPEPLEPGRATVHLLVDDFDACLDFYTDLLGASIAQLDRGEGGRRFALLRLAGALEFLIGEPGCIPELGGGRCAGVTLVVPHPDVRGARAVLARRYARRDVHMPDVTQNAAGLVLSLPAPSGTIVRFVQAP